VQILLNFTGQTRNIVSDFVFIFVQMLCIAYHICNSRLCC